MPPTFGAVINLPAHLVVVRDVYQMEFIRGYPRRVVLSTGELLHMLGHARHPRREPRGRSVHHEGVSRLHRDHRAARSKDHGPEPPDCGPRVGRRFESPLDGVRFRGRIDLLLRAAGPDPSAVEIVDIKTAENRPPLPQHQNQLRLHAEAARTLSLKPVRLVIHGLDSEDGAAISVEENPRELARFQEDMCRWVHGIRSACFVARRGPACGGCDYANVCGSGGT